MAFQYLNNRPLDEARSQYLALLQEEGFAPRTETIPVPAARRADHCRGCVRPHLRTPLPRLCHGRHRRHRGRHLWGQRHHPGLPGPGAVCGGGHRRSPA